MRLIASSAGVLIVALAGAGFRGFLDGPPPAHTGGFGERTCTACHSDVAAPDPAGAVLLSGLPESGFSPGVRYLLTVRLSRPGMGAGGFQLSARDDAGAQGGMLRAISPRVWTAEHGGVTYAQQTRPGAVAADSAAWQLEWTAPTSATAVHFHLAGNAANGDDSAFGDHVYTASRVVAPINDNGPSAEASRP